MKHKRFSEEKIIGLLKEHEAGAKVDEISGGTGSAARRSTWRKKFGGTEASDAKRLRD